MDWSIVGIVISLVMIIVMALKGGWHIIDSGSIVKVAIYGGLNLMAA